jgi:hypothetical protein
MIPAEVFLSHSSADRLFADAVAAVMRRHGVPVWYSQTDILGAQQWHDEIGAALRRCDWFALALSPHSVESRWVKRECLYALQQPRFEQRIIPLLHQPCDYERLSWALFSYQMVDFTNDFEAGCATLPRVWGLGYRL